MMFSTEDEQEAFWRADESARKRLAEQRSYNDQMAAAMFGPWLTALNQMSIADVLADVSCADFEERKRDLGS